MTEFYGVATLAVELSEITDLRLYPNPVVDQLQIETAKNLVSFCLMNSLGQVVVSTDTLEQLYQLTSNVTAGVYLLEVVSDTQKIGLYRY